MIDCLNFVLFIFLGLYMHRTKEKKDHKHHDNSIVIVFFSLHKNSYIQAQLTRKRKSYIDYNQQTEN